MRDDTDKYLRNGAIAGVLCASLFFVMATITLSFFDEGIEPLVPCSGKVVQKSVGSTPIHVWTKDCDY